MLRLLFYWGAFEGDAILRTHHALAREAPSDDEQKQVALGYLQEAWAEARFEGIEGDCLAQASLFTGLAELVLTYGEDAAAKFAEGLAARIRNGEFTIEQTRQ